MTKFCSYFVEHRETSELGSGIIPARPSYPIHLLVVYSLECRIVLGIHLIQGSNNRKAKKENTKPNSQKALGSLTSTAVNVGAQSTIHSSQPESSNVSLGAGYVAAWHILMPFVL